MKTEQPMLRLIREGESETLEFKESFGKDVIETVCAFGNSHGGTILVGVSDRGVIKGVSIGKESLKVWSNQIAQTTGLHPSFRITKIDGNPIVVIKVNESRIKPVMFHGKPYWITFKKGNDRQISNEAPPKYPSSTHQVPHKYPSSQGGVTLSLEEKRVLRFCAKAKDVQSMMALLHLRDRKNFAHKYLHPFLVKGFIRMTDPGSPRSPKQKYVTTETGLTLLKTEDRHH